MFGGHDMLFPPKTHPYYKSEHSYTDIPGGEGGGWYSGYLT